VNLNNIHRDKKKYSELENGENVNKKIISIKEVKIHFGTRQKCVGVKLVIHK
jgi:hypothetical protein